MAGLSYGMSYGVVRAVGVLEETEIRSIGCTLVGPCHWSTHGEIRTDADAPPWVERLYGAAIAFEEHARFD